MVRSVVGVLMRVSLNCAPPASSQARHQRYAIRTYHVSSNRFYDSANIREVHADCCVDNSPAETVQNDLKRAVFSDGPPLRRIQTIAEKAARRVKISSAAQKSGAQRMQLCPAIGGVTGCKVTRLRWYFRNVTFVITCRRRVPAILNRNYLLFWSF